MAQALRYFGKTELGEDILTVAMGFVDGLLLDKAEILFLLKNLGVPAAKVFGVRVPEWLENESEGMLGLLVYSLLK